MNTNFLLIIIIGIVGMVVQGRLQSVFRKYSRVMFSGGLTGREVAEKMYARHRVLSDFLISLGVDKDVAANDACKIEHHISDESFEALKRYICK